MRSNVLKLIGYGVAMGLLGALPSFAASTSAATIVIAQAASAAPYLWSATKSADGTVSLVGNVPSADIRDALTEGVDKLGIDATKVVAGGPPDFSANAVAALSVLADLDSGVAVFDGTSWTVSGVVAGADKAKEAQSAFDESPLKSLGAAYKVVVRTAAGTPPAAPATPPATASTATAAPAPAPAAAADYAWSAEKSADGSIAFGGDVPNAKLKAFLVTHAEGKTTDSSTVAGGAPKDFVGGALYGLNALMTLDSGKLTFANGKWTLAGSAKSDDAKKSAMGQLSVIDTKAWSFDISTGAAAASAPAAAPAPAATAKAAIPAPAGYTFSATRDRSGGLVLTGDVPSAMLKGHFSNFASSVKVDGLAVKADGAPKDFAGNAIGGLNALDELESGELKLDGGKWSLTGNAPTPEMRDSIVASLGKLPAGSAFVTSGVEGPPPLEYCRLKLDETLGASAIKFDGRSSKFAKGSDASLDAIAQILGTCPDTRVNVAGATDSDGRADANMALSVARAEAVTGALAKRGIAAKRLYAIGYGETLPLVPKATKPADRAKNNRIEITVEDVPQN